MDMEEDRLNLQKAAEQGDTDAQYELGLLYATGQGVPLDAVKAEDLLSKAVARGNQKAKDLLAKTEFDFESNGSGITITKYRGGISLQVGSKLQNLR